MTTRHLFYFCLFFCVEIPDVYFVIDSFAIMNLFVIFVYIEFLFTCVKLEIIVN